jgi:hypothetical protein
MCIIDIRHITVPIASDMANAFINFSKMDVSVLALAIASGCGLGGSESYPGIFEPFGGFADGDTVDDGSITLPDLAGIGLELKSSLRPILAQLRT